MNKSNIRQAGKPWKLEHLRQKHRKSGSNTYGTQMMTEKHRFKSWIEHAEHRKITGHEIRSRRFMSDQKFMSGLVLKVYTIKPKKPNSGNRKVARVRLRNGQIRLAYIPFEHSTLTDHSTVLVYFHPKKDMVGVKLRVLRGAKDSNPRKPRLHWPALARRNPGVTEFLEDYTVPPDPLYLNYDEY